MTTTPLALPGPPPPARPRVLMIATALGIAGAAMLLMTLVGAYLSLRTAAGGTTGDWVPDGASLPLVPANIALITLLMSSVTVQWAITAIGRNDRSNGYLALGLTVLFGFAYVNSIVFYIGQLGVGIDSTYGVVTYATLGAHLALTVVGIVFLASTAFRALGGHFSPRDREGLAAAAMAWHAVVAGFVPVIAAVVWLK